MTRSTSPRRTLALALALGVTLTFAAARCFRPPDFDGPYPCSTDPVRPCGDDTTLVCDLGVCCRPGGDPPCPSALDGGVCADGGTALAYYLDLDHDGFGDPNTLHLLCSLPPPDAGLVTTAGDCNDNPAAGGPLIHPGAQEQCDGLDNNCDGQIDEGLAMRRSWFLDADGDGHGDPNAVVLSCYAPDGGYVSTGDDCAPNNPSLYPGAPCNVPNVSGACRGSSIVCVNSAPTCPQTVSPVTETCNSLDDNCNGQVDDQPGCGGPVRLDLDPDVSFGVKHLATAYQGVPTGCVKGASASSGTADGLDSTLHWTGTGVESHVFWAENKGGTWDLSLPTSTLRVPFSYSVTAVSTTFWSAHNQPVILVCGPNGTYVRLVHSGTLLPTTSASGNVNAVVDLHADTGSNWVVGSGSTQPIDSVLKQAKHIEVLIQPASTCSTCAFTLTFDRANLGFSK